MFRTIRVPLTRLRPINRFQGPLYRFNSTKPPGDGSESKGSKSVSKRQDQNVSQFKVKQTSSPLAPAPTDGTGIEMLMKKNNKPYLPKSDHQRLSYEYPGLPNEDNFGTAKPKTVTRWTRYLPKIITVLVVGWGVYVVKLWMFPSPEEESAKEMLDPYLFHTFVVTHKEQIDDDHFLVEIVPKLKHWQYLYNINYDEKLIWNGDRMWLVEIQQPDIAVVRSYTPLPLYFMKSEYTRLGEKKPLLRVINNDSDDYDKGGTMCLYVKRYKDGEVLRYITSRNIGDELLLRGPNIDYQLPYHPIKSHQQRPVFRDLPLKVEAENGIENIYKRFQLPPMDNMVFYGAGTGIAPMLQVLFSRNPYRGFVTLHYSARNTGELGAMERFLFFLEKLDRANVVYHYDSNKTSLRKQDFVSPAKPNYESGMRLELQEKLAEKRGDTSAAEKLKMRMAILEEEASQAPVEVETERTTFYENALAQAKDSQGQKKQPPAWAVSCGPTGYLDYVSGSKELATGNQGPVSGELGKRGWDNSNTFKLQ